jgi:A/G-specific adenine glycosylase
MSGYNSAKNTKLNPGVIKQFQRTIYAYYHKNKRYFPWRNTTDPYHILVSEIMLQQTQTSRVVSKYEEFTREFPDFSSLAHSDLRKVLQLWQGLGYNRRAIALHKIAQIVVHNLNGELPKTPEILDNLPGIGPYTASAIVAIAYNQPAVFIETNIRAVYLHFFFLDQEQVRDSQILDKINQTLDQSNPRKWYYALFDYGAMLKGKEKLASKSVHYRKQSPFKGSNREVRSKIVRLALSLPVVSEHEISDTLNLPPATVKENLVQLQKEGFIRKINKDFRIA